MRVIFFMIKKLQYLIFVLFAMLTMWLGFMLVKSWQNLNSMKTRVAELEEELQEKNTACLELTQKIYELKNNPYAVEKVAREKFRLAGDKEVIYVYPEKDNKDKKIKGKEY